MIKRKSGVKTVLIMVVLMIAIIANCAVPAFAASDSVQTEKNWVIYSGVGLIIGIILCAVQYDIKGGIGYAIQIIGLILTFISLAALGVSLFLFF